MLLFFVLLLWLISSPVTNHLGTANMPNTPLTITVTNLKNKEAAIYLAVYKNEQDFGKSEGLFKSDRLFPKGKSSVTFSLPDIPYGAYAIGVYQDINGNEKLDTGFLGIPKEPYGFSNNFKPVFSGPTFEKCKFTYSASNHSITIALLW